MNIIKGLEISVNETDVKDALLASAIQSSVSTVITTILQDAWKSYETKNMVQKAISEHIGKEIRILLEAKYQEQIREVVHSLISEETIKQMAGEVAQRFLSRLKGD